MSTTRKQSRTAHNKLICCLLAVEIAEHETKHVFDQVRLTQNFRQILADAIAHAASHDLLSIVREDGALLSFIADPKACFAAALRIREAILSQDRYRDLQLRIGISLGTVETVEDEFGHVYMSGEARQDAERVMRQGPPCQICVARSFFGLLFRTEPELAGLLKYEGLLSDTIGPPVGLYRLHPPFNVGPQSGSDRSPTTAGSARVIDSPRARGQRPRTPHAGSTANRPNWYRSTWPRHAFLAIVTLSVVFTFSGQPVREFSGPKSVERLVAMPPENTGAEPPTALPPPDREDQSTRPSPTPRAALAAAPEKPDPAASLPRKPTSGAAPVARYIARGPPSTYVGGENPNQQQPVEAGRSTNVAPAPPPIKPGTLYLAVRPWGEVYVDGRRIGVTPPLKRLDAEPGRRVISITNGSLPIYQREVMVAPGTMMTVAHDFSTQSPAEGRR